MRRILVVLALAVATAAAGFAYPSGTVSAAGSVGPKPYYLALGDSLAYGYQPSLSLYHGYVDDFYTNLHSQGTTQLVNMACPAETTSTFINGGCPFWWARKVPYSGSQLSAAIAFINAHPGQVSPVTLDIGANDVLPILNPTTCTVGSNWQNALNTFNANFTTIVQQLSAALNGSGDLLVMTYYDPYQNQCASNPDILAKLQTFNADIVADTAGTGAQVVPVFQAFGGAATPNARICAFTWMCTTADDIHPTSLGYAIIALAFALTAGY